MKHLHLKERMTKIKETGEMKVVNLCRCTLKKYESMTCDYLESEGLFVDIYFGKKDLKERKYNKVASDLFRQPMFGTVYTITFPFLQL